MGSPCKSGHRTATICCCTTPSNVARSTPQGGNVTTRQTCNGSQPPKSTHQSVSANAVAAHLIQVAKAPHDKTFERQVRMQGRTLLQQMSDKSLPYPFTEEEISTALQKTKPATAPGYDNIYVEFLKSLSPKLAPGCPNFFSRIVATHSIQKM